MRHYSAMAKVIRREPGLSNPSIDFDDNTAVAVITNEINHGDRYFISYRHDKNILKYLTGSILMIISIMVLNWRKMGFI